MLRALFWLALLLAVPMAAWSQDQLAPWTLKLRYGGGTPNDAGPLGHCTATFASDGKVKIESKGRKGVNGPSDIIVYQAESLPRDRLQAIFQAADAALKEQPFKRRGANEDGEFFVLERSEIRPSKIGHYQLSGFSQAPPGMKKLMALVNDLLPENERVPLK